MTIRATQSRWSVCMRLSCIRATSISLIRPQSLPSRRPRRWWRTCTPTISCDAEGTSAQSFSVTLARHRRDGRQSGLSARSRCIASPIRAKALARRKRHEGLADARMTVTMSHLTPNTKGPAAIPTSPTPPAAPSLPSDRVTRKLWDLHWPPSGRKMAVFREDCR